MTIQENIAKLTDAALEHRESGEALLAGQDATCWVYFVAAIANATLAGELRAQLESEAMERPKSGEPA